MKNFLIGTVFGALLAVVAVVGYNFLAPKVISNEQMDLSLKDMGYAYVDFKFKDLVLYDIGIKVNNELYVRPDKLMAFMGKEVQYTNGGAQIVITERPENTVMNSSTTALGQSNKKKVGDMLDQTFTSQHWEADPEVEGKLVFRGIDNAKNQYEIVFLINNTKEMTIQTIYLNGSELSDDARLRKIKELFGRG